MLGSTAAEKNELVHVAMKKKMNHKYSKLVSSYYWWKLEEESTNAAKPSYLEKKLIWFIFKVYIRTYCM